jgi:hypothetical protein
VHPKDFLSADVYHSFYGQKYDPEVGGGEVSLKIEKNRSKAYNVVCADGIFGQKKGGLL